MDRVIIISLLLALALTAIHTSDAQDLLPTQGMPVPQLDVFDFIMRTYMDDDDNDIDSGVLGIMKDDRIVYLRSFGWKDEALSEFLPENALMRIASVNKPLTAAAIHHLETMGAIRLDQRAFALDPTEDGILDYEPFGGVVGDTLLKDIEVIHLLRHRGGWDRDIVDDLTYREVEIAEAYGFDPYRVPTRRETVEWILSQPLQHDPGDENERHYANIGFLILGLIVEQVSGMDLHTYWREFILDSSMWFPASEFEPGRTFAVNQNPREPWYNSAEMDTNVFDPYDSDLVPRPYGGWNHEARIGQGGLISGAVPLLHLANNFYTNGDSIGVRLNGRLALRNHDGRLDGTEALVRQRTDGINYAILLNKKSGGEMYVRELKDRIDNQINAGGFTWPTQTVDGVWFDFYYNGPELGCYDKPYDSINDVGNVMAYSKIRFKPGSTTWTGVITQGKITLSAPEGTAIIGE